MQSVLVVTISGQDRAGLVERLADVVAANGGNWEHCRMAHLAGRFVGLLQVTVPGEQQQELEAALRTIKGLDVMIAAGSKAADQPNAPLESFQLELLGSDQPGIVRDVFRALAAAGVSVEELATSTLTAADSGLQLFRAQARLSIGGGSDLESIQDELQQIASDILVDIHFTSS